MGALSCAPNNSPKLLITMEKNEFILAVNKQLCNALVDRKKIQEILDAAKEEGKSFHHTYGLERSIDEFNNVLLHLWSTLGSEINYDLRNLCLAIDEEEAAAKKREEEAGDGE